MVKSRERTFLSVDPKASPVAEVHKLLLGGVAPRPIALVSTVSTAGINNLSPFSFFNAFGANPPTVVFSPARRGRDGTTKDTLNNLKEIGECVVQSVSYDIVQQVSLASTEYEPHIDEFAKSGLTPIDSDRVRPKRVEESPYQMECTVKQIIPLGESRGSGNMVICEVVKIHVDESIIKSGVIEPNLIDLVGRNSANYYTRASGGAIFEVEKPLANKGIGVDRLPAFIRESHILSANNLGQLGNVKKLPEDREMTQFMDSFERISVSEDECPPAATEDPIRIYTKGISIFPRLPDKGRELIEIAAQKALTRNDVAFALKALLSIERLQVHDDPSVR